MYVSPVFVPSYTVPYSVIFPSSTAMNLSMPSVSSILGEVRSEMSFTTFEYVALPTASVTRTNMLYRT